VLGLLPALALVPGFLDLEVVPGERYPERAVPAREVPVALVAGGAEIGKAGAGASLVVVETTPDAVRVVDESRVARIAFWIPAVQLPLVAREGAEVRWRAGTAAHVRLRAGTVLDELGAENGGRVPVRWESAEAGATVEGWVERARVGRSYVPEKRLPYIEANASLRLPARLLDGPKGQLLADVEGSETVPAERVGDGLLEVELGDARAVGWVNPRRVGRRPKVVGRSLSAGRIGIPGKARHVAPTSGPVRSLERGALLYAEPGGEPVGVVTTAATFAVDGDRVVVTGPFGEVRLVAR
jgi:hypothetical protein